MNTNTLNMDAREGDRNAAAHEPQPLDGPIQRSRNAGAVASSRHTDYFDIHQADYVLKAQQMGYRLMYSGAWRHARLGFTAEPVRRVNGTVDRQQSLLALADHLTANEMAERGFRTLVGGVIVLILLVVALVAAMWPMPSHAQTAAGEAAAIAAAKPLATEPLLLARCEQAYTLAGQGTVTFACYHPGTVGTARVSYLSGNAWVQATLYAQRAAPGYAAITLHNLAGGTQHGVAVVEVYAP